MVDVKVARLLAAHALPVVVEILLRDGGEGERVLLGQGFGCWVLICLNLVEQPVSFAPRACSSISG